MPRCLLISFILLAMISAQILGAQEDEIIVSGIIQGVYDFDEVLVGVKLMTEEKEYYVADNPKGMELLAHVGKQVEVTGTLSKVDDEEDVIYVIYVSTYRLLE